MQEGMCRATVYTVHKRHLVKSLVYDLETFFYFVLNITMPVTKAQKKEILQDLEDKFGRAKAVYFAAYSGLDVKGMKEMRVKMRASDIDYKVAKKTLMRLAMKKHGHEDVPREIMEGPVGAAFSYDDAILPAKIIHTFGKDHEMVKLLGGLVDGKFISKAEALELAILPSRQELLAKLVGSMNAPVAGFYGVLHGLLRGFVYALGQIEGQKPAAPAAEAKSEEATAAVPVEASAEAEASAPVEKAEGSVEKAEPAKEAEGSA